MLLLKFGIFFNVYWFIETEKLLRTIPIDYLKPYSWVLYALVIMYLVLIFISCVTDKSLFGFMKAPVSYFLSNYLDALWKLDDLDRLKADLSSKLNSCSSQAKRFRETQNLSSNFLLCRVKQKLKYVKYYFRFFKLVLIYQRTLMQLKINNKLYKFSRNLRHSKFTKILSFPSHSIAFIFWTLLQLILLPATLVSLTFWLLFWSSYLFYHWVRFKATKKVKLLHVAYHYESLTPKYLSLNQYRWVKEDWEMSGGKIRIDSLQYAVHYLDSSVNTWKFFTRIPYQLIVKRPYFVALGLISNLTKLYISKKIIRSFILLSLNITKAVLCWFILAIPFFVIFTSFKLALNTRVNLWALKINPLLEFKYTVNDADKVLEREFEDVAYNTPFSMKLTNKGMDYNNNSLNWHEVFKSPRLDNPNSY